MGFFPPTFRPVGFSTIPPDLQGFPPLTPDLKGFPPRPKGVFHTTSMNKATSPFLKWVPPPGGGGPRELPQGRQGSSKVFKVLLCQFRTNWPRSLVVSSFYRPSACWSFVNNVRTRAKRWALVGCSAVLLFTGALTPPPYLQLFRPLSNILPLRIYSYLFTLNTKFI